MDRAGTQERNTDPPKANEIEGQKATTLNRDASRRRCLSKKRNINWNLFVLLRPLSFIHCFQVFLVVVLSLVPEIQLK